MGDGMRAGIDVGQETVFEYTEIEPPRAFKNREHLLDTLNHMGQDGWELVHFDETAIMIFKREVTAKMQEARMEIVRAEQQQVYRIHMAEEHDTLIYIGDAVAEHTNDHPDCEFGRLERTS